MKRTFVVMSLLVASTLCLPRGANAASAAVREACTDDAKKLCGSVISNAAKRHACMAAHKSDLSEKCLDAIKKSKQD